MRTALIATFGAIMSTIAWAADVPIDPLEQEVKTMIHEVAIPSPDDHPNYPYTAKQAKILFALEHLDHPAVPYIVKYMKRYRTPLRVQPLGIPRSRIQLLAHTARTACAPD